MPTIGLGTAVAINDGTASAFVDVTAVTSITWPEPTMGSAESKRLSLASRKVPRTPTMLTLNEFSFQYEFSQTEKDRLDAFRDAGTSKSFRVTLPVGASSWTKTVTGFVTSNGIDPVVADGLITCTCTVQMDA